MPDFNGVSLKIVNYKCFDATGHGFDKLLPMNVIIGRNNSGKSALLDVLDLACHWRSVVTTLHHGGKPTEVWLTTLLTEPELRRVFEENVGGGEIPGPNHWLHGKKWIGRPITHSIGREKNNRLIAIEPPMHPPSFAQRLAGVVTNPFSGLQFARLAADRDVTPEASSGNLEISPAGAGLSNAIQHFINDAGLPSSLIEQVLLDDLNAIYRPDASFERITVQRLGDERWEVFLDERHKGRIALSNSGSGLKTVLLVLARLMLDPAVRGQGLDSFVFGFEELENNLHPAIQRRLFRYLRELAVNRGCCIAVTTHSHVVIDMFANDAHAQLLHVTHSGTNAVVKPVRASVEIHGVLDDLDVRASDLLQSNCVVWVEGPSDRLYVNRWIELASAGELVEGVHYQCVFYGGRLLAHLSADASGTGEDAVRILRVNRHAILLVDSDRRSQDAALNATKTRMVQEVRDADGVAWVSAGREVENYIPDTVLARVRPEIISGPLGQFDALEDFLDQHQAGAGQKFARSKVVFAEEVVPHLEQAELSGMLDWSDQIDVVCRKIRLWNNDLREGVVGAAQQSAGDAAASDS